MSVQYPDLIFTSFPENNDIFTQFLDILASDGAFIKEYKEAIASGNQALAMEKLEQIPAYRRKILTSEDLNKFSDAIIALERFYGTDITPYINTKQAEWQAVLDDFSYKGTYDVNSTYKKNNYVEYGSGESRELYIAIKDVPSSISPVNSEYWRKFTVKGEQGVPGAGGLSFLGAWDVGTNYTANNIVEYDGALWNSSIDNVGVAPSENESTWIRITKLGQAIYPVSVEQPSGQMDGDLWFRIVS